MNKLLSLLFLIILFSCTDKRGSQFQKPKTVIIAGKILNYNEETKDVKISVNRPGLFPLQLYGTIDSIGNFSISFQSYTPTDAWIVYKTNFLVLIHPGDSLHVIFDGNQNQRAQLLSSVKFSGDGATLNEEAAIVQKMYYSSPLYIHGNEKSNAMKELDTNAYLNYQDSIQEKKEDLFEQFVTTVHPGEESKLWASVFLKTDYYSNLFKYTLKHLTYDFYGGISKQETKELFYNKTLDMLPVNEPMLISGMALRKYVNVFRCSYISLKKEEEKAKNKNTRPKDPIAYKAWRDSLTIHTIVNKIPDELLKQLVLSDFLRQEIGYHSNIKVFEKYMDISKRCIKESFLWEPLFQMYLNKKQQLENSVEFTEDILIKASGTLVKPLLDSILNLNKGKIIYMDCWATWCGSCKAEMPYSKKLMEELTGKNVVFVFVCLDSEVKKWKSTLNDLNIGGQHYFLTKEQSSDFRKIFNINGVPDYIVIDKEGVIINKGNGFRPVNMKEKLLSLSMNN